MPPSEIVIRSPTTTDPRAEYARRAAERAARAQRLAARHRAFLRARHIFVGALVAVAWICEKEALLPLLLVLPVVLFVVAVLVKNHAYRACQEALRRLHFYQRRLANLDGSWVGTGESGNRFLDDAHPYARDLDLFGPGSLFERLHLAGSCLGEDALAAYLRTPAELVDVRARQAAVAELCGRLDFREDLAQLGQDLPERAAERSRPFGRIRTRLLRESFVCPLLRLQATLAAVRLPGPVVRVREVLPLPPRLFPFLTLNRWLQRHGPALTEGEAALRQLEALQALAAYAFENPADPFPELHDAGPCFEADSLAHPLLPLGHCVGNDVLLNDSLRLLIVSGSNMSGKSTLLRTVGANTVLALAGAPVRARRLRLSRLTAGATLRLQDSLQEGRSRFYAEVTRVRQLLDLSRGRPPLLFLLDELFSGTNSDDRRQGAEAVVRRLLDAGAIGLLTTHDLALTQLAELLGPRVANVHFADEFAAGELTFDYRMRPGVLRNGNGVAIMRALGIEV